MPLLLSLLRLPSSSSSSRVCFLRRVNHYQHHRCISISFRIRPIQIQTSPRLGKNSWFSTSAAVPSCAHSTPNHGHDDKSRSSSNSSCGSSTSSPVASPLDIETTTLSLSPPSPHPLSPLPSHQSLTMNNNNNTSLPSQSDSEQLIPRASNPYRFRYRYSLSNDYDSRTSTTSRSDLKYPNMRRSIRRREDVAEASGVENDATTVAAATATKTEAEKTAQVDTTTSQQSHTALPRTTTLASWILDQQNKKRTINNNNNINNKSTASSNRSNQMEPIINPVPTTNWVMIDGIPPLSSWQAMETGLQRALQKRYGRNCTIYDVDAPWTPPFTTSSSILHKAVANELAPSTRSGERKQNHDSSGISVNLPTIQLLNDNNSNDLDQSTTDATASTSFTNTTTCTFNHQHIKKKNTSSLASWIVQTRVVLSPYARPRGWLIEFENRSIVQAVLVSAGLQNLMMNRLLMCGNKPVTVQPYYHYEKKKTMHGDNYDDDDDDDDNEEYYNVSDATLWIENCNEKTNGITLMNVFSRYDLRMPPTRQHRYHRRPKKEHPKESENESATAARTSFRIRSVVDFSSYSIIPWKRKTPDGVSPPPTWLIHFRNASWARAALRDIQGRIVEGYRLHLAQYPSVIVKRHDDEREQQQPEHRSDLGDDDLPSHPTAQDGRSERRKKWQ